MHTFHPRWDPAAPAEAPSIGEFRFTSADDVIRYCELDCTSTWRSWQELWHLDSSGEFRCYSKGSSISSIRDLAETPKQLLRCRDFDVDDSCPNRWVIIESRHTWQDWYEVGEGDAAAFAKLRRGLGRYGVSLLDVVILNEENRWWSLHELTTGTTTWP